MRQTNIELCRIISIMLVVLVHSNFAWQGWPTDLKSCNFQMLFVEAIAIVGVNVFVLITGYFSASIKTKTFVNLFYICLFYAIVRLIIGVTTCHLNMKDILFVSNSNWFIPAYIGLILLTPWLNAVQINRKVGWVIFALLLFEIYFGYFPAQSVINPYYINWGYSIFSFAILYLLARYIRQYGVPELFKRNSLKIYLICSIIIAIQGYVLAYFFEAKGLDVTINLKQFVYAYNSPIVIVSSVAFFVSFVKLEIQQSKIINHIAQSAIGVLLVHTSEALNWPMKAYFAKVIQNDNPLLVLVYWIFGLLAILIVSVMIDQLRIYSYKRIGTKVINKIDYFISSKNI